jgi:hypothetical protein
MEVGKLFSRPQLIQFLLGIKHVSFIHIYKV